MVVRIWAADRSGSSSRTHKLGGVVIHIHHAAFVVLVAGNLEYLGRQLRGWEDNDLLGLR